MRKKSAFSQEKYIKACRFAAEAHIGHKFEGTDIPYLFHISLVSMEIIASLEVEEVRNPDLAVQCALLHDVIEDGHITYQQLKKAFGWQVADGLDALTKKDEVAKSHRLHESIKRILIQPPEIHMVKLADHISNLQPPPDNWPEEKKISYFDDSQLIYASLKNSSQYLADRLLLKINNYRSYIK